LQQRFNEAGHRLDRQCSFALSVESRWVMGTTVGLDRALELMQAAMEYLESSKYRASSSGNVEASECVDKAMRELRSAVVWSRQSKAEGAS
jgi:hypothetical protein